MRLISVEKDELRIGQPLPFALYDLKRNVVLERGSVIADAAQLRSILDNNPLRELSAHTEYENVATAQSDEPEPELHAPSASAMIEPTVATLLSQLDNLKSFDRPPEKPVAKPAPKPASNKNGESSFSFLDMRLRVGDRIQLQLPASMGTERYVVRLIGYVENASVLVSMPATNGMSLPVRNGDNVVARVFTSRTAFAFDSTIERVSTIPYNYLHLSYPAVVQGAVVRQAPRVKTKIIASIAVGEEKHSAVIQNISARGALISMRQPLSKSLQHVMVSFRINLHGVDSHLHVKAVIRNVQTDDKDPNEPLKYHHGVEFLELQATDNMILQSLIYQQMIEFPQNLI
jgi:c-di-GMP-binding flagellar brake protein YcgR